MEQKTTETKVTSTSPDVAYAGFGLRVGAWFIDVLILFVFNCILITILGNNFLFNLVTFIIGLGYFVYFESSEKMATPGKQAVGIVVTDEEGQRISQSTAAIRYISKVVSTLILFVGYLMVLFTDKKQGLHDIIAKTLVVKK